jgi:voltage-gated potassium channel Kch
MNVGHSSAEAQARWRRWLLVALVTGTLVFGFWGTWTWESEQASKDPSKNPPDVFSVLYHSAQLLIAHGVHLEGQIPWQLHVGRLLGVLALFTAGLIAFARFFREEMLSFQLRFLPWNRNHVLICGLGDLGLRLALDGRRRGKFVVAIEKEGSMAAIERARKAGVLVLDGDACDPAMLHKARVDRAEFVVASCAQDSTNVAVAAEVSQTVGQSHRRNSALVCRLLLRDSELRRLLERAARASTHPLRRVQPHCYVNLGDLNLEDTAARQALRSYPLDFERISKDSDTLVHLVVVGFSAVGQSVALHAARVGHFANGVTKDRTIRITIVDRDADKAMSAFRAAYPEIDSVCELRALEASDKKHPSYLHILEKQSRSAEDGKVLVTYAVCFQTMSSEVESTGDDRDNLRIGTELSKVTVGRPVQTLIYQSTRRGFAALLSSELIDPSAYPRLHDFGMLEDIFTWDTLLHESEDRLARAIHEDYAENRRREGKNVEAWEELPEELKNSNRHAADHIPAKLRALGYHDAPIKVGHAEIERFGPDEVLLLSQMEHLRWCAERWLDGWKCGPETIREQRINRCLVRWDQLQEEDRQKDPEQINAIPRILRGIGRGIYPADKT